VETERVYILSLGSQQGNRHVHWHIAPLPYGVPFKEQQLEALRSENGILDLSEQEMKTLTMRIRQNLFVDDTQLK
jgi:ATP adenylyltransferase